MALAKRLELTAIVHTYNEEKNIAGCLEALRWVDELIVVDMYSTDKTVEIAGRYTDKIYFHENAGYADPARNFGLSKAEKDWVLWVDADERVTQRLKQEIIDKVLTRRIPSKVVASKENPALTWPAPGDTEFSAYYIPVADYMFGRWVKFGPGSAKQQCQIRFARRDKCSWPAKVHSRPQIDGLMSIMEGGLLHFSHLEISNFLNKLNKYTSFEAKQRFESGTHYSLFNTMIVSFSQLYMVYIKQKAYKEGVHGFITTILMFMYTFVYRAKLWEMHYKATHPNIIDEHEPLAAPEKINTLLKN